MESFGVTLWAILVSYQAKIKKKHLFKKGIDRFSLIAMTLMPKSAIKQNTSEQM